MKRWERQLHRLFEAAKPESAETPVEMTGALQTRILADWRGARAGNIAPSSLALVFRGALVCAGVVMVLTILWSYGELRRAPPESGLALANYELQASLTP